MNPISFIGAILITLSLLSYGIGSITLQRFKMVGRSVLWPFFMGIVLDVAAIVCMIIGSNNSPFTLHGVLGFSAFIVMFVNIVLISSEFKKYGRNSNLRKSLEVYARFAYSWWVIVYAASSLLIIY